MSEIVVQLEHVNIYQSGNLILQDVNFEVQKGEFVYLVGKTGTGKSSLLKTLYGEITLTEGKGKVVGFDLRDMDWKKLPFLRRNLGIVFQDFQLLTDRNVHENLSIQFKEIDIVQLTPDQNNQMYRILQEIIQNTIKHAQATLLQIEISKENNKILLIRTSDNGIGYDLEKVRAENKLGLGLLGIQSRVDYLNGTMNISDDIKKGTRYNIRIPIFN